MLFRRKNPESKDIRKFVDILYQFEKEHPDELCPPETDPQLVVNCLCDVFFGSRLVHRHAYEHKTGQHYHP